MPKRSSKKPVDINLLAKYIVDDATAEKLLDKAAKEGTLNIIAINIHILDLTSN